MPSLLLKSTIQLKLECHSLISYGKSKNNVQHQVA